MSPRTAAVLLTLTPAVGVVVAAPPPDKKAVKEEVQRLQGDWETVPTVRDGKKEPHSNLHGIRVVIRGRAAWIGDWIEPSDDPPSDERRQWPFAVDPARSPKV